MVESEYAKAIYEIALEENKEQIFTDCFKIVLEATKDKDFYSILTSPFIDVNKKKEMISNVFNKLDTTFINFLKVIIDYNRVSKLKGIFEGYTKLNLEHNDIVKIDVISAVKLDSMQLIHLSKSLQNKYIDKKIELENIIDPKLIGGIQIVSNGESLDMSLKTSLNRLKDSL